MAISILFDGKNIRQLGAYVKTDLSAVRQINGVGTGIAGIAGLAEGGIPERPYRITSFSEALSIFRGGPLVEHIQALFIGGVGEVVATRLRGDGISSAKTSIELLKSVGNEFTLDFSSKDVSSRANNVFVQLNLDKNVDSQAFDDKLVINVYQKNPDLSVSRELYEFPSSFNDFAVLVRRGNTLSFVQDFVLQTAKYNCAQQTLPKFIAKAASVQTIATSGPGSFWVTNNYVNLPMSYFGGVNLVENDVVLIRTASQTQFNGLFKVGQIDNTVPSNPLIETLVRYDSADLDTIADEVAVNDVVRVELGAGAGNYYVNFTGTLTYDTTPLSFVAFTGCLSSSFPDYINSTLQDVLLPDDAIELYNPGDDVPLALVMYELVNGGLFGNERSRLVNTTINNESYDSIFDHSLFTDNPAPFYVANNTGGGAFEIPDPQNIVQDTYTIKEVLNVTNNGSILSEIFALTGGSNGNDGTNYYSGDPLAVGSVSTNVRDAWVNAWKSLEEEEVNFVVPAYKFNTRTPLSQRESLFTRLASYVISHATLMSQTQNRKRRIAVVGYPAPENPNFYSRSVYLSGGERGVSGALNTLTSIGSGSDRVQAWVGAFRSGVFGTQTEILGGEYLASYMVGKHANREPQNSITFDTVSGIGAEFIYNWTYTEKDQIILQRLGFVEKVKNTVGAEVQRIHHNPVSWVGSVSNGFQEMVLRRIDDFLTTYLYKNLEQQFVGRPSLGRRAATAIKRFTESLLDTVRNRQIVAYRDVVVTPNEDNTAYAVEFWYQPISEIKFILLTMRVSYSLE